ncbi:MAG: hypothetical protein J6T16_05385 [Opitutales bacterium]|nr:hypothetical protein [Opitutales bacterium]
MNKGTIATIITGLCALLFAGCASEKARYVESGGARSVVTTKQINMADWNRASAALVNKLLSSGKLESLGLQMPIKAQLSSITNRTTKIIDTSLLTEQVLIALNDSNKVEAISDDEATQQLAQEQAKLEGKTISLPQITITGRINEVRDSDEDTKEVTYVFSMQVNYQGRSIWRGQEQIAKQADN